MPPPIYVYNVRVFYAGLPVLPDIGYIYGPFEEQEAAEQCLVSLAGRADVRSAAIEKKEVV